MILQLGQTNTAADGQYEIRYMMPAGGKLKPDLIVRVDAAPVTVAPLPPPIVAPPPGTMAAPGAVAVPIRLPTAPGATVAPGVTVPPTPNSNSQLQLQLLLATPPASESALISNAPTVAMVDLGLDGVVLPVESEHLSVTAVAQPVLDRAKLAIGSLQPAQVDYVAGAAGLTSDRLQMMVDAAQLSAATASKLDEEVSYALLRTGYQDGLEGLLDAPISVVRARLEQATDLNQLSATRAPQLDTITSAVQDAAIAHAFPSTGSTLVSDSFSRALATPDVQQAYLRSFLGRDGSSADFWDAVRADPKLAPHADDLETTLRLQVLFGGFSPILTELKARRQAGSIKSHRDLARWQDGDWQTLFAKTGVPPGGPGDTPTAKTAAYAAGVAAVVRAAFPTEFLRGKAAQPIQPLSLKFLPALAAANPSLDLRQSLPDAPNWGSIAAADQPAARAEWEAFRGEARAFRNTPASTLLASTVAGNGVNPLRTTANQMLLAAADLDLENVSVDQYLAAHPTLLENVSTDQKPAIVGYLQSVQRVVRIVDRPEAVDTLLADGVDSALRIARMPRAHFVDRYQSAARGRRGGGQGVHDRVPARSDRAARADHRCAVDRRHEPVGRARRLGAQVRGSELRRRAETSPGPRRCQRLGDVAESIRRELVVRLRRLPGGVGPGGVLRRSAPHDRSGAPPKHASRQAVRAPTGSEVPAADLRQHEHADPDDRSRQRDPRDQRRRSVPDPGQHQELRQHRHLRRRATRGPAERDRRGLRRAVGPVPREPSLPIHAAVPSPARGRAHVPRPARGYVSRRLRVLRSAHADRPHARRAPRCRGPQSLGVPVPDNRATRRRATRWPRRTAIPAARARRGRRNSPQCRRCSRAPASATRTSTRCRGRFS